MSDRVHPFAAVLRAALAGLDAELERQDTGRERFGPGPTVPDPMRRLNHESEGGDDADAEAGGDD